MTDMNGKVNRTCLHWTEWEKRAKELEKENAKFREMIEDMKANMCSTNSKVLCDYLVSILKKYGEIV